MACVSLTSFQRLQHGGTDSSGEPHREVVNQRMPCAVLPPKALLVEQVQGQVVPAILVQRSISSDSRVHVAAVTGCGGAAARDGPNLTCCQQSRPANFPRITCYRLRLVCAPRKPYAGIRPSTRPSQATDRPAGGTEPLTHRPGSDHPLLYHRVCPARSLHKHLRTRLSMTVLDRLLQVSPVR